MTPVTPNADEEPRPGAPPTSLASGTVATRARSDRPQSLQFVAGIVAGDLFTGDDGHSGRARCAAVRR